MDAILTNMFHLGLPWGEKVLRPVVVYLFLVIGLRLAGWRHEAALQFAHGLFQLLGVVGDAVGAHGVEGNTTGPVGRVMTLLAV